MYFFSQKTDIAWRQWTISFRTTYCNYGAIRSWQKHFVERTQRLQYTRGASINHGNCYNLTTNYLGGWASTNQWKPQKTESIPKIIMLYYSGRSVTAPFNSGGKHANLRRLKTTLQHHPEGKTKNRKFLLCKCGKQRICLFIGFKATR